MSGWIVEVETEWHGGGGSVTELYAVGEANGVDACELVKKRASVLDEKVRAVYQLSDAAMRGCGVQTGECRLMKAMS